MLEINNIRYYSQGEIDSVRAEFRRRQNKYKPIRSAIIIAFAISLACNLHFYFLYKNASELLYLCNAEKVLTNTESQVEADRSISKEEKEQKREKLKEERQHIIKRTSDALYDKRAAEVVGDIVKKANKNNTDLDITEDKIKEEILEPVKTKAIKAQIETQEQN